MRAHARTQGHFGPGPLARWEKALAGPSPAPLRPPSPWPTRDGSSSPPSPCRNCGAQTRAAAATS
eukprot:14136315-Alexandrium_andersonii.AAC.1